MKLANKPPKGTLDRFPTEYATRKYIFDTRRTVCTQFGYKEYLAPLVEESAIFEAKSGEDVGNNELTRLTDKAGNVSSLVIRPEMTPSVTRMISQIYPQYSKPIKWFSIANFYRNEKPQRGRNREFWQLNIDCFGSNDISCEKEIIRLGCTIMQSFQAPKHTRSCNINHRDLIIGFLNLLQVDKQQTTYIIRLMDKRSKLSSIDRIQKMQDIGLDTQQSADITKYMDARTLEDIAIHFPLLTKNQAYTQVQDIINESKTLGYDNIIYDPSIIRGFDYYDGVVCEFIDKHPDNSRSLFGGGRYNGLGEIFGSKNIPAVGIAPGDESMKLFLVARDLLPKNLEQNTDTYYLPLIDSTLFTQSFMLAQDLRTKQGIIIEQGFETIPFNKIFALAQKKGHTHIIIYGQEEYQAKNYKIKCLTDGTEKIFPISVK